MTEATKTDAEILDSIRRILYELDLHLRLASLRGYPIDLDLVDRVNPSHPAGYTTVVAPTIE